MTTRASVSELIGEIRALYAAGPAQAPERIERLITARLAGQSPDEGRAVLEQILERVQPRPASGVPGGGQPPPGSMDAHVISKVMGLLLGRDVTPDDLSSTEVLERLAQSLNTIFNSLNELISVINTSFSGGADTGEQTIRQFIGFHLEGGDQMTSLQDYLGQINKAFLTTHEAFKKAAHAKVEQILNALETEPVANGRSSGLKIGPLRKAHDYDVLKEKIDKIRRWFDSGRFMEDFLREFERNCQIFNLH
jgi:hypothetical protein